MVSFNQGIFCGSSMTMDHRWKRTLWLKDTSHKGHTVLPHTSTSKPLNKGPFQSTKVSLTTGVFTTPGGVCTGGSSPQGSYDLIMPPRSATSGLPPHLPPLLQQTVLNQEPPSLVYVAMCSGGHQYNLIEPLTDPLIYFLEALVHFSLLNKTYVCDLHHIYQLYYILAKVRNHHS